MLNLPSASVTVPVVEPLRVTETPEMGLPSPVVILPVMRLFWAMPVSQKRVDTSKKRNCLLRNMAINFDLVGS